MGKDFIMVFSLEDSNKLKENGYQFVDKQGDVYIFKDNKNIVFSEDNIKMIRTDVVML